MNLLKECGKRNLLDQVDINLLNDIRGKRNASAHYIDSIDKETANNILHISTILITKLESIPNADAFTWLMYNRNNVINLFKEGNSKKCKEAINKLRTAWNKRDGAVSGEIGIFFETALINAPHLIIELFDSNDQELENWLSQIDYQIFTDFIGGQTRLMQKTKNQIIQSLETYISHCDSQKNINKATRILNAVKIAEIYEID
nr:hypothetical protein [Desulfovibrio gilichinskyi]